MLNPSQYSVYGLPTYADAEIIHSIIGKVDPNSRLTIYTDWRTGLLYIHDSLQEYDVSVHSRLWSITLGNLELQLFGSYGYRYDGKLRTGSFILFRETSTSMVECWRGSIPSLISDSSFNSIYSSGIVTIYGLW